MVFLPIYQDQDLNEEYATDPNCADILQIYLPFYGKVGFNPPWIGYFVSVDSKIIGGGGFKGSPKNNRIEIAYGVFDDYQKGGYGTEICRKLVLLTLETDPELTITARTLPDNTASINVLKKNGFELKGNVWDDDDGDVLEWIFKKLK